MGFGGSGCKFYPLSTFGLVLLIGYSRERVEKRNNNVDKIWFSINQPILKLIPFPRIMQTLNLR
jgi:hypothetical protein